jgi:Fatty acid cis/trans isomerase (CTI)
MQIPLRCGVRRFFTVLPEGRNGDSAEQTSVLEQLLLMHETHEFQPGSRLPQGTEFGLKRTNVCPSTDEIKEYKEAFPHGGMPLGVTGLTDSERQTLLDWIRQGARFDSPAVDLSARELRKILTWERFLNHNSPRRQLLARWLYEHLFMAHLYFGELFHRTTTYLRA